MQVYYIHLGPCFQSFLEGHHVVCNGFLSPQGCFNLSSTGHDREGQAAVVCLLRLQSMSLGVVLVAGKGLRGFLLKEGAYLQLSSCFTHWRSKSQHHALLV